MVAMETYGSSLYIWELRSENAGTTQASGALSPQPLCPSCLPGAGVGGGRLPLQDSQQIVSTEVECEGAGSKQGLNREFVEEAGSAFGSAE